MRKRKSDLDYRPPKKKKKLPVLEKGERLLAGRFITGHAYRHRHGNIMRVEPASTARELVFQCTQSQDTRWVIPVRPTSAVDSLDWWFPALNNPVEGVKI